MLDDYLGKEYQPFHASDIVDQSIPHLLNFRGRARSDHRLDKEGKITPYKRFPMCVPHCCFRWTEGSIVGPHTVSQCPILKRLAVDSLVTNSRDFDNYVSTDIKDKPGKEEFHRKYPP